MGDLDRLVASRSTDLAAIAGSWIAAGATSVELWGSTGLTARWSPELELGATLAGGRVAGDRAPGRSSERCGRGGLRAPIEVDGRQAGWLRLQGIGGAVTRRRLIADAAAIGSMLAHEGDLAAVTAALIEAQDQLLGIATLLRAVDPASGPGGVATAVAREALTLLDAAAVAVVLPVGAVAAPGLPVAAGWSIAAHPASAFASVAGTLEDTVLDDADPAPLEHVTREGWLLAGSAGAGRSAMLVALPRTGAGWQSPALRLAAAIADLATTLASQAAGVAEARERERLARELGFAGEVQRLLLGRGVSALPGVSVATRYRPAGSVGGDLFAIRAVGRRTLLAVGDVSGKGAAAGLLMASARAVFEAVAAEVDGPGELLDRMAAVLADDLDVAGAFLTLCIADLDAATAQVRIANAGHAPVALRTRDGVRLLAPEDPPLGVLEGLVHVETTLPFGPGDLLILASDGITEREDRRAEPYGIDRLLDQLATVDGTPDRIADALLADVDRFADARPRGDDETLLVARGTHR